MASARRRISQYSFFRVGHWQIRAQWVPSDDGGEDAKVLTEVHALLEGSFDYTLTLEAGLLLCLASQS